MMTNKPPYYLQDPNAAEGIDPRVLDAYSGITNYVNEQYPLPDPQAEAESKRQQLSAVSEYLRNVLPTPPAYAPPNKWVGRTAAIGDIFNALAQTYRGFRPVIGKGRGSYPAPPVQPSNYYGQYQVGEEAKKQNYYDAMSRRGLIAAQMAPSLMQAMYPDSVNAADVMRARTSAIASLAGLEEQQIARTEKPFDAREEIVNLTPAFLTADGAVISKEEGDAIAEQLTAAMIARGVPEKTAKAVVTTARAKAPALSYEMKTKNLAAQPTVPKLPTDPTLQQMTNLLRSLASKDLVLSTAGYNSPVYQKRFRELVAEVETQFNRKFSDTQRTALISSGGQNLGDAELDSTQGSTQGGAATPLELTSSEYADYPVSWKKAEVDPGARGRQLKQDILTNPSFNWTPMPVDLNTLKQLYESDDDKGLRDFYTKHDSTVVGPNIFAIPIGDLRPIDMTREELKKKAEEDLQFGQTWMKWIKDRKAVEQWQSQGR